MARSVESTILIHQFVEEVALSLVGEGVAAFVIKNAAWTILLMVVLSGPPS